MKKTSMFLLTILILVCSFILGGCSGQAEKTKDASSETQSNISNPEPNKLTIEEIKKKYTDTKIKNIQNIGKDFVLIESQQVTFASKFDIYNLKTGDMDTMPTETEFVTLEKIENENYFIFLASGKNSEGPFVSFPYVINCIRVKNEVGRNDDFIRLQTDKYYNLEHSVEAGSKAGTLLADLKVSFDGLQVLFEPVKGTELEFFADSADIPRTKTSYNKEKKQIVFEIGANQVGDKLKGRKNISIDDNQFISSCEITQRNNKIYLAVTVKDTVKTYMAKKKVLPDGLPYFTVVFSTVEF